MILIIAIIMLGMYAEFSLAILSEYSYVIIYFSFLEQRTTNNSDVRRRTPSLHQTPGTRKITCKTTIYGILVLLAAAAPIMQILLGIHYIKIDKTHASRFLIANSVVYLYLFILGLCKVSKRCVSPYKCCLTLLLLPLLVAICIGFGLLADFHSWNSAYNKTDYKFCDPFIFMFAYILNICNYFIFLVYAIDKIANHYCSREIYCCGEIV